MGGFGPNLVDHSCRLFGGNYTRVIARLDLLIYAANPVDVDGGPTLY